MSQVGVGQGKCAKAARSMKSHKKLRAAGAGKCRARRGPRDALAVWPKRVAVASCSRLRERREATSLILITLTLLNRINLLYLFVSGLISRCWPRVRPGNFAPAAPDQPGTNGQEFRDGAACPQDAFPAIIPNQRVGLARRGEDNRIPRIVGPTARRAYSSTSNTAEPGNFGLPTGPDLSTVGAARFLPATRTTRPAAHKKEVTGR
jgi:hypothetical protein